MMGWGGDCLHVPSGVPITARVGRSALLRLFCQFLVSGGWLPRADALGVACVPLPCRWAFAAGGHVLWVTENVRHAPVFRFPMRLVKTCLFQHARLSTASQRLPSLSSFINL
jgi:hypothetical protein